MKLITLIRPLIGQEFSMTPFVKFLILEDKLVANQ